MSNVFPDISIDSISFENKEKLSAPLKTRAKFYIPNVAMSSGDFLYLTPSFLTGFDESPFKLETRLYPVDIGYPSKEHIILNITLPEGYTVEELPESVRVTLPNNAALFQYQLTHNGNQLQFISKLQINDLHYKPEEYPALRNFFSLIEEKFGEQVVLKKI